jgi:membrane fusion protein (multidrug efflux system)
MNRRSAIFELAARSSLLVAILLATFPGCSKHDEEDSTPQAIVDVRAVAVQKGRVDETIVVSGNTQYRLKAQLRSPIAGLMVKCKMYNGDKVKKGELVAQIRTKESQATITGAEQLLNSASTPAQREEARKALDLAEKTVNTVNVVAPTDGIFSEKAKNELELVAEGDLIGTIVDPASLIFLAQVPTSSIGRVHPGQPAVMKFTTRPGRTYAGVIHRIQPEVNPGDQSIPVQVTFATPNQDLEGSLFGECAMSIGEHKNVLIVPKTALLKNDENNTTSLMIVGTDSLAHKVEVSVGLGTDSTAEVSSPLLAAGSLVITEGHYGLPDSTRVRIVR